MKAGYGGVAQGLAGTLYEKVEFDEDGNISNANFVDFLVPYATEIPKVEMYHLETPTPLNPLGVKVGEVYRNRCNDCIWTY